MNIDLVKKEIRDIICRNEIITNDITLADDALLSEYGFDSVCIVELIISIEEKYDFEFSSIDLNLKDFETINSISLLVNKLLKYNQI